MNMSGSRDNIPGVNVIGVLAPPLGPPLSDQESCLTDLEEANGFTIPERGGHGRIGAGLAAVDTRSTSGAFLVGRKAEWAALHAAFDASRQGKPAMVLAHGASGMGKRFLMQCFLREIQRAHPDTVVLAGRCYERSSSPYKALGGLVEPLARVLVNLPGPERAGLLPPHMPYLARIFPVLRQLREIAPDPAPGVEPVVNVPLPLFISTVALPPL